VTAGGQIAATVVRSIRVDTVCARSMIYTIPIADVRAMPTR